MVTLASFTHHTTSHTTISFTHSSSSSHPTHNAARTLPLILCLMLRTRLFGFTQIPRIFARICQYFLSWLLVYNGSALTIRHLQIPIWYANFEKNFNILFSFENLVLLYKSSKISGFWCDKFLAKYLRCLFIVSFNSLFVMFPIDQS
jgi:hypothetical protein